MNLSGVPLFAAPAGARIIDFQFDGSIHCDTLLHVPFGLFGRILIVKPMLPKNTGSACIERLEARRLLASAGQYFPLAPGSTWNYSGLLNGQQGTDVYTAAADTLKGSAVTRVDDVTTLPDETEHASDYYSVAKDGIYLLRSDDDPITFDFDKPLLYIPGELAGIKVYPVSVPAHVTIDDPSAGMLTGTGTVSGTVQTGDSRTVQLPNHAGTVRLLKLSSDLTYAFTGKSAAGKPFSLSIRQGETLWLAPTIGVYEDDADLSGPLTFNGTTRQSLVSAEFSLTDSNLLLKNPPTMGSDGILTVPGTDGDDAIIISNSIYPAATVSVNGVALTFKNVSKINIFAGDGNDNINLDSASFHDHIYVDAGAGNDYILGSYGDDTITGGAGKDTIFGSLGNDRLNGSGGHDSIQGNDGDDRIYGGNENDSIEGGNGVDRIWGGIGDDQLSGGASNDKLFGEDGNDSLFGGNQNDLLDGGTGKDLLRGDDGNDVLSGAGGDDILIGSAGIDSLWGDAGNDTFSLIDHQVDHADGGSGVNRADADPDDVLANLSLG